VRPFVDLAEVRPQDIWDGVAVRAVHGERLTLGVVEIEPGVGVPEHRHDHEQLGIVLAGSVTFRVGDETRLLDAGSTWCIPSNTPHEVTAGPEGAAVLDVFAPPRDDWSRFEAQAPRAPRWPT